MQTTPCQCVSVSINDIMITMEILKTQLRWRDLGTWQIVGKSELKTVFKINAIIMFVNEDYTMLPSFEQMAEEENEIGQTAPASIKDQ